MTIDAQTQAALQRAQDDFRARLEDERRFTSRLNEQFNRHRDMTTDSARQTTVDLVMLERQLRDLADRVTALEVRLPPC